MQHKHIMFTGFLLVFFSIQSFGQDSATNSSHPKMDKYYPRPQNTQVLNNNAETTTPSRPVTPASSAPVMTTAPASNNTVVSPAPTVTPTTPKPTEPQMPTEPQIQTGPAVTSTPVSVEPTNTNINSSNSVTAPTTVTVTAPPPKIIPQPKGPPEEPYMDTRLGSSSPQYDTWKKNNNGAGSVTTQSKQ